MNDPHLIEKHLADGLSEEEVAELDASLCGDLESARGLVAAARLNERLVAKLGVGRTQPAWPAELSRHRKTPSGTPHWLRPLAMAAALVLVLALAVAMNSLLRSVGPPRSEPIAAAAPTPKRPFVPAVVGSVTDRPEAPRPVEKESPSMASLRRFLSSYYLTDMKLGTARPLDEALERLLQRARELNHLKNPVIERLSAELAAAEESDGRPETVVALPLKDVSLMDGLKWIAASNRSEVFLKEPGVITFRPWEPDENETLVTEVVRVRPDLLTRPVATDEQNPAGNDEAPSEAGADAFVGTTEAPAVPRLTPIELFQSLGIAFGEQASASYDEAAAAMTIRQTASTLRMIRELVGMKSNRPLAMLNVSTKIIEFTHPRPIKDEILTAEQFQVWLRETNQTKGVDLLTAPQITTRSGQRALVEIIRSNATEGDWQGVRIPIAPVLEGEVIKVVGAAELRLQVDRKPGQLLPAEGALVGELTTMATDFEGVIPDGQTALFALSEGSEGPRIVMTVTVNRIGAGMPSEGENTPLPELKPQRVGP